MLAELLSIRRFGPYAHLVLAAPAIARRARPGQFVEVRLSGEGAPFWRRPFSICRAADGRVELLIKARGRGSALLAALGPGAKVDVLGPLGKGFTLTGKTPRLLVGGGYGIAPLLFLAQVLKAKKIPVEVFIGGRCEEDLLLRREMKLAGAKVTCSTEDGSVGFQGRVTMPLEVRLRQTPSPVRLAACGPHGLLQAVTRLAQTYQVPAEVSLETVLACGLGVCNGCVVKIKGEYQRVCKDGPVFSAQDVDWHA
ncbi:MAG: dihydroorotate dehydrogenase electron transfer subunit [Candidatus Firestonebacteria bacterium]|nr:dihydroorotate dehydrogenase electron transfer subunit [Candidatus Firestonebacteria bacterium]